MILLVTLTFFMVAIMFVMSFTVNSNSSDAARPAATLQRGASTRGL